MAQRKSYQWTRERELALLQVMRDQGEKPEWALVVAKYSHRVHGESPPASLKQEALSRKWNLMKRDNFVVRPSPPPCPDQRLQANSAKRLESYRWTRERELALIDAVRETSEGAAVQWSLVVQLYSARVHPQGRPANLKKETLAGKWLRLKRNDFVVQS